MSAELPRPMPFAIMRNAHEALRASIRSQAQKLDADHAAAFREEWQTFQCALVVHMAMEDNSMFDLLDAVSAGGDFVGEAPGGTCGRLETRCCGRCRTCRSRRDCATRRVVGLERESLASPCSRGRGHDAAHHEDGRDPGCARVVHERLLGPSEDLPNFDWYIGWVVRMLSEHGSEGQPANVATRTFAWGLQHSCSPSQWNRLRPIVQQDCTPAIWAELSSKFGLNGDGPIV